MVMPDGIGIQGLGPLDVDQGLLGPGISLGLEADTTPGLGADTSLGPDNCLGREQDSCLGPAHLLLLSRIILSLFWPSWYSIRDRC